MKRIKLFFFVILIQIFILNNIQFSGYINPYYYIIFILTIPHKTNKISNLILSFLIGFTIDIFSNTYGAHAFACVLISYLKIIWTNRFNNKDAEELLEITKLSFQKFVAISTIFIAIHHFTIFLLERFTFLAIWEILGATITTTIFTLISFIIHKILSSKKHEKA
ncbi:MAG: rod shape-determining protein MreD [Flavobacteriales bacterium]|mgnify:FL=1|nr:rod shape-determining protein MreD [Flavobacteriales bacterium]